MCGCQCLISNIVANALSYNNIFVCNILSCFFFMPLFVLESYDPKIVKLYKNSGHIMAVLRTVFHHFFSFFFFSSYCLIPYYHIISKIQGIVKVFFFLFWVQEYFSVRTKWQKHHYQNQMRLIVKQRDRMRLSFTSFECGGKQYIFVGVKHDESTAYSKFLQPRVQMSYLTTPLTLKLRIKYYY